MRTLTADLLLLAPDARRGRLRLAVKAAGGSRRRAATVAPNELAALRMHVSRVLMKPAEASARDQELVACLLCAGALAGRQRAMARALLRGIDVASAPPAIAWLCDYYGADTVPELADALMEATADRPTIPEGALDTGPDTGGLGSFG